ncbi:MAG: exo-alpha-sialidase [Clostridia bacterium]|nr:exo-alpha-sialidase [Clostridia bacterium]
MKSLFRRIVAFVLVLCTLALVACANNGEGENGGTTGSGEADNTVWMNIVEGGLSEYCIVVPLGRTEIFTQAYKLATAIKGATGVMLQVKQDTYAAQDKEILVGITSREVAGDYGDDIATPDDFVVAAVGSKVLLYGSTDDAVTAAVDYVISEYVDTASDSIFKVPEDMKHLVLSNKEYITITDGSKSDYIISVQSSDGEGALKLQSAIEKLTGAKLAISTGNDASEKEIVIGSELRTEALAVQELCTSAFGGKMKAVGKKLFIVGGCKEALGFMVEHVAENLGAYIFKGNLMIAVGDEYSKTFGDELAEPFLESINFKLSGVKYLSSSTEVSRVYTPDGTESAWYYSHHPFMTYFKGTYYIFYSSSKRNEDCLGQRIMMATSTDYKNWTVKPLVDSIQGENYLETLTCFGVYVYEGTLTVYVMTYEYASIEKESDGVTDRRPLEENAIRRNRETLYLQTTDGQNWSELKSLGGYYGGNLSPVRMGNLLIWAGYGSLSYTEDLSGTSGWKFVRLKLALGVEEPNVITESGLYQMADGTIVIFSRTNDEKVLTAASFDGGYTWTDMYESNFNDYSAKFELGTLPDGRYYFLGNISTGRNELVLMTSENGVDFNKCYYLGNRAYTQQKQGLYKGGDYGYPTSYFDDEYMYVVYSCGKEAVETLRIKLTAIEVK